MNARTDGTNLGDRVEPVVLGHQGGRRAIVVAPGAEELREAQREKGAGRADDPGPGRERSRFFDLGIERGRLDVGRRSLRDDGGLLEAEALIRFDEIGGGGGEDVAAQRIDEGAVLGSVGTDAKDGDAHRERRAVLVAGKPIEREPDGAGEDAGLVGFAKFFESALRGLEVGGGFGPSAEAVDVGADFVELVVEFFGSGALGNLDVEALGEAFGELAADGGQGAAGVVDAEVVAEELGGIAGRGEGSGSVGGERRSREPGRGDQGDGKKEAHG